MEDQINVAVSGTNPDTVEAVSSVIHSSLAEAGFHNAVLIGDGSSEAVAQTTPEQTKSLLDLYQKSHPELFATPISITSDATVDTAPASAPDEEPAPDSEPEESIEV